MITINQYLNLVLSDFAAYVEKGDNLCYLNNLRFNGSAMPDYSNLHTQQLYELRYSYGYAFAYKQMFARFFSDSVKHLPPWEPINVLSIGCGNMVDYWALKQVLSQQFITYVGIDPIAWNYSFAEHIERGDQIGYLQKNAVEALEELARTLGQIHQTVDFDYYIFPQSISEFTMEELKRMGKAILSLSGKETLHFFFSLRYSDRSLKEDMKMIKAFYQFMKDQGLFPTDDCQSYDIPDKPDVSICQADSSFHHPKRVIGFLTEQLPRYCHKATSCEKQCMLSWYPILNSNRAKWKTLTFDRIPF